MKKRRPTQLKMMKSDHLSSRLKVSPKVLSVFVSCILIDGPFLCGVKLQCEEGIAIENVSFVSKRLPPLSNPMTSPFPLIPGPSPLPLTHLTPRGRELESQLSIAAAASPGGLSVTSNSTHSAPHADLGLSLIHI